MGTTPEEEYEGRTHIGDEARQIVESTRLALVGRRDIRLRTLFLLVLVASVLTLTPDPAGAFGMGGVVVLAYWMGWHKI